MKNLNEVYMRKIFVFCFLLFFISVANATTEIPNANTTDNYLYSSNNIDTKYMLNTTDSLIEIVTKERIYKSNFPYTVVYQINDSKTNILKIKKEFLKEKGVIYTNIIRKYSIYLNNVQKNISDEKYLYDNVSVIEIPFLSDYTKFDENFNINGNEFYIRYGLFKKGITNFDRIYYFNGITLPNSTINKFEITHIDVQYQDNGISKADYEIQSAYTGLNPVFKFVFLLFKGILKITQIITLGYITELDYINYQSYLITPLTLLDTFMSYIYDIIRFILTLGVVFMIVISEMIIFIYAFVQSKDIYETFNNWLHYSYIFLNYVIIKPLVWLYENLLIGILTILRG